MQFNFSLYLLFGKTEGLRIDNRKFSFDMT